MHLWKDALYVVTVDSPINMWVTPFCVGVISYSGIGFFIFGCDLVHLIFGWDVFGAI